MTAVWLRGEGVHRGVDRGVDSGWHSAARVILTAVILTAACVLASSSAWALGGLVTPDGTGTIVATRAVVARGADEVRIVAQMRYQGTPATAVWLVPIPDSVMMGGEISARAEAFGQAGLDALAAATDPVFTGECDGLPTGMSHTVPQIEQFGPAPAMLLPTRFFSVAELIDGDLDTYLTSVGLTADMAMQEAITGVVDQNFMLAAVRIDTAMLGVNRVDPVISIRYPHDGAVRLGLRMLAPSVGAGPADVVLFLLDDSRVRTNFPTEELAYDQLSFTTPTETNHGEVFVNQVGARQSQAFIVEAAQPVDQATFADAEISALIADTGASFLTRLHARVVPVALRSNLAFVGLRAEPAGAVARDHVVTGFGCGVEPDVGVADMGAGPDDTGVNPADMGGVPVDPDGGADTDGDVDEGGGGGGGGCLAAPGLARGWPALLLLPLLLALPGVRRRR